MNFLSSRRKVPVFPKVELPIKNATSEIAKNRYFTGHLLDTSGEHRHNTRYLALIEAERGCVYRVPHN